MLSAVVAVVVLAAVTATVAVAACSVLAEHAGDAQNTVAHVYVRLLASRLRVHLVSCSHCSGLETADRMQILVMCYAVHFHSCLITDWADETYPETNILRLIYQGRFLHGNVTLGGTHQITYCFVDLNNDVVLSTIFRVMA